MRRVAGILVVFGLVAAPAMAGPSRDFVDRSSAPILTASSPVPVGEAGGSRGVTIYDSIGPGTGGYFAASPVVGPIGWDDYGVPPAGSASLTAVQFVGGMTATGGVAWFEYRTAGMAFVTSFGVVFPAAGNFLWTISLSTPFSVPHAGLLQIVANSTFTGGGGTFPTTIAGQWFLTTPDALVVGSNNPTVGGATTGGAPLIHTFRFDQVPEPATLALLGTGLLFLVRRR